MRGGGIKSHTISINSYRLTRTRSLLVSDEEEISTFSIFITIAKSLYAKLEILVFSIYHHDILVALQNVNSGTLFIIYICIFLFDLFQRTL